MNPLKLVNPVTATKGTLVVAGKAIGTAGTVARGAAHVAKSGLQRLTTSDPAGVVDQADSVVPVDSTDPSAAYRSTDLPFAPLAADRPPVDVVGQALAAEAALGDRQSPEGAGFAHEPKVASHDEEHGDAPMHRTEREEMDDEVTAALEGDLADEVEAEEHLTQPILDPGAAKALAAEMEILSRAADPDKG